MKFRTVFISDIHLGTHGCGARELLSFLNELQCETLYLVGDVIDVWALKSHFYWPKEHMNVLQKFLDMANSGTTVKFIPGNHDEMFRDLIGLRLSNIEILYEESYTARDGKRYLVLHGDKHDVFHVHFKWFSKLCTRFQNRSERVSAVFSPQLRVAKKLKSQVKSLARRINQFEKSIVSEAKTKGYDGVLCGHFHSPALKKIDGIIYCNDGDWVQNRTAVVEEEDGSLSLFDYRAYLSNKNGAHDSRKKSGKSKR